jgi:hypothetical protein
MLADGGLNAKRRDGLVKGELTAATGNRQAARWQCQWYVEDDGDLEV